MSKKTESVIDGEVFPTSENGIDSTSGNGQVSPPVVLNISEKPATTQTAVRRIQEIDTALRTGKSERRALIKYLQTQANGLSSVEIQAIIEKRFAISEA